MGGFDSRPPQQMASQRRAYAACRHIWPEVDPMFISQALYLVEMRTIGQPKFVIAMIVGDTQRVIKYPRQGMITQDAVPLQIRRPSPDY